MKNKRLRVLVVSPDITLLGGVAETVRLLLRELQSTADVSYLPFGRRNGQKWISRFIQPFGDLFTFARLLSRKEFDVIHMNPSMNFRSVIKEFLLFTVFYLFGYSGRVLFFIHGWEQDFFEKSVSRRFPAMLLRAVFNNAGEVLVLADSFNKSLVRAGVEAEKVRTGTTMINLNDLPSYSPALGSCRTLLYLSRVIKEKGVYEIVDAFELLKSKYPSLKLIIAGDGPELGLLQDIIKVREIEDVSFPGFIKDREKFEAFEKSCIFLLPTRYGEGCPVALLEAMGAGLVPVVADAGGIRGVIRPGENAVLLDEITEISICMAVDELLQDDEKRQIMSLNAARYAKENFSSEKVTDIIYGCYTRISENADRDKQD